MEVCFSQSFKGCFTVLLKFESVLLIQEVTLVVLNSSRKFGDDLSFAHLWLC